MACMTSTAIEARIEEIKGKLQAIGSMRPGSLSKQYTVCGKPGCRCVDRKHPRKHGPYYQLSYVHQGKSTTQFIRPPFVPEVKRQLRVEESLGALCRCSLAVSAVSGGVPV